MQPYPTALADDIYEAALIPELWPRAHEAVSKHAEARVARGIVEGKTIEAIAVAGGVSRETIRTQLAAVFSKTGLNRQAELVVLLAGKSIA